MSVRPARRSPPASAPSGSPAGRPRPFRFATFAIAGLALAACAAQPPPPADPLSAATAEAGPADLPAGLVVPAPGRDRGALAATGDQTFTSGASARCVEVAGPDGAAADLRIELDPDDTPQPLVVVTVPSFSGGGDYDGTVSLRLDTADGTFTESTGAARIRVESPPTAGTADRHLSGSFTAAYAGAAGDGEAAGRFTDCSVTPPQP